MINFFEKVFKNIKYITRPIQVLVVQGIFVLFLVNWLLKSATLIPEKYLWLYICLVFTAISITLLFAISFFLFQGAITDQIRRGSTKPTNINSLDKSYEIDDMTSLDKKILYTLWQLQALHYPKVSKMVTFTMFPYSSEFKEFAKSTAKLMSQDLLTIAENSQYFLTSEGLKYCLNNEAKLGNSTFYPKENVPNENFELLRKSINEVATRKG